MQLATHLNNQIYAPPRGHPPVSHKLNLIIEMAIHNAGMSMDTAERSPMLAVPGDPPRKCMQLHILKQDPLEARGGLHQV